MVYRYSWIAGAASIGFAVWRLSEVLQPTRSGAKWQLMVLASVMIGIIVTWAAVSYRMRAGWIALLNLALFVFAAARYGAPNTGVWVLPGPDTFATLATEIERAVGLIRHGVEPVQPTIGLVVILAGVFWLLGSLLAFGLLSGRPFVALAPPLVIGLQLLTVELQPSSNMEIALFVFLVAATTLAVGLDEHDRGAGRMARPGHHPSAVGGAPVSAGALGLLVLTVVGAIGVSSALASQVPTDGNLTWRTGGSLTTGYYGGVTYNPYVSIHRGLVSQSGAELFTARLDGAVDPTDVYYRLITLDTYDDGKWYAAEGQLLPASDGVFEDRDSGYAGPTVPVNAALTIHALRQGWLPAPYAVTGVGGEEAASFRIRTSDVSVRFSGNRTYNGMEYAIAADVPVTDSRAIVTDENGRLSPLFAVAAEEQETVPEADPTVVHRELPDAERYVQLPDGLDPRIGAKADELTDRFTTAFEKGLALEYWFRESGGFVYSLDVDVEAGHGPDVVARWLFDPDSTDYRRGFCEDFATSMGVMARSIGIPTRVVLGFTPGEVTENGDVLVTDRNGHSWVELWIPSQGWMRFDPTPRGDGINPAAYRTIAAQLGFDVAFYLGQVPELPPEPQAADVPNPGLGAQLEPIRTPIPRPAGAANTGGGLAFNWPTAAVILALAAGIIGVVPALKWARHRARMRRLAHGDVSAAWEEVVARLADLDHAVDAAATPHEVASTVDTALDTLALVYTKSVYGPEQGVSTSDLEAATRSMTVTTDRLTEHMSRSERARAQYRLRSVLGPSWRGFSRWLPWPRR
ncbi:MAG: transglutaminase domain-containing protein [Acidobacteria bacterium]|nr:transglutaminase domain-containing protein [Acidobacteriota bacterium]